MPLVSDQDIKLLLQHSTAVALVGASAKSERPSYRVMQFLLIQGYSVYPVNPGQAGLQLLGCEVYPDLASIPVPIDIVDVFRQPQFLMEVVEQAIAIGAKAIWGQLGVVDHDAASRAEAAGLHVVMDRCPAIEIPRLGLSKSSPQ